MRDRLKVLTINYNRAVSPVSAWGGVFAAAPFGGRWGIARGEKLCTQRNNVDLVQKLIRALCG